MARFEGARLLVATHNAGKLEEMAALLAPFGVTVVGAAELGLPEPAETESTFVGNARIKAHAAAKATGLPALADDSGIEVDALDGAPGVYTADWAETPNGRDFGMAMTRTWAECEAKAAPLPRTARFRSTLVLAWPDGSDQVFEGKVEGTLVWPMRGAGGHGYDPMFMPVGHDITFAEMDPALKNTFSHRADAFAKFVAGCFA
ncbi:RdgB/HAM1 family non-canonical purine NTP pyrophosphatase [Frigidibacter albus]|uniref:dITP/XTP pyrophosphatase n=1 Tax=Frigidibacter albus TaxID=1465486 RepID=A0A6L8VGP2_9RHOB|nr:RdgB/HAM1 family non-canonical purine NTP pyrophosphatase [Frigidibacter albus]MZQ89558.1 RdgB/HAM1 family non-canonical purine NTP pyrophosphatase [Frigidibacter albus]NBE31464.1 RdgB/HAM1 family non-canonical purine NTP pyrophosphatase [Frigidibacter albus]GGH55328.1 non-canonical purine NTP pyrophosphatase [Frigidibacter albus]